MPTSSKAVCIEDGFSLDGKMVDIYKLFNKLPGFHRIPLNQPLLSILQTLSDAQRAQFQELSVSRNTMEEYAYNLTYALVPLFRILNALLWYIKVFTNIKDY